MSSEVPSVPIPGLEEELQKRRALLNLYQPVVERWLKRGLAVVVAVCGTSMTFMSPTEDVAAMKVCGIVVAVGAALGITSSGNPPKR